MNMMAIPTPANCRLVVASLALLLTASAGLRLAVAEPAADVATFLRERGIDQPQRGGLETATEWGDEQQKLAIRVLSRLAAPAELTTAWRAAAVEPAADAAVTIGDALVKIRGRATFVAPVQLTAEQEQLAAQPSFDVVRITAAGDRLVDVLVKAAPKAWPRWQPIDEPVTVVGLPLSAGVGPRPTGAPDEAAGWPEPRPGLVMAATGVAWEPATPLGTLGMNYTLFDSVRDGGKLEPGDAEAFYGMLAAVAGDEGRREPAVADQILKLIDPGQKWYAAHRGEPVTISGIARKATKIAIDEPFRREQLGTDHYWELFVFVNTPLIRIDGQDQDTYPIVCCVRDLPAGMPTGDSISEGVRIDGFALKRYGYPLADVSIISSQGDREEKGKRRETALLVARRAEWRKPPSTVETSGVLSWIFAGLGAAVAAAVLYGVWASNRAARRAEAQARSELPDRIELPGDRS
jgi:hypothetical protein